MEEKSINDILSYLKDQRGFDFTGYRKSMLERRLQKRIFSTNCTDINEYQNYLSQHPVELDELIDVFTINVSEFFRNSMVFEFIRKIIIPELVSTKAKSKDYSIRIWSAGCSHGEEPYSMAILLNEHLEKEEISFDYKIFATDIDKKVLAQAENGVYPENRIEKIKYGILSKYFTHENDKFKLDKALKHNVRFSFYDLMDTKSNVPVTSIFGGFDIVLCRNVLIYFEMDFQKAIFEKLYNSLKPDGYLILGVAEMPVEDYKHKFSRVNNYCKIYRKK